MSDKRSSLLTLTEKSVSGTHPEVQEDPVRAAPADGKEFNTVRARLIPKACWKLEDSHFAFDSSFVLPLDQTFDAGPLKKLVDKHPGAKLSIFGHADPVGQDTYNKNLSGRRAQVIFGMLVRDVALWEDLYFHHDFNGNDEWGARSIQVMLTQVGFPTGRVDGTIDDSTKQALENFQVANGLPKKTFNAKKEVDAGTFQKLARLYMDSICTDDANKPFQLSQNDFLARGKGKHGKGDFQGCSEFNPLMIFSQAEKSRLDQPANASERNTKNQVNRRVMVLLFRPGSEVDSQKWPCPTVKEGITKCHERFFSDGEKRRSNQALQRELKDTRDTFACRFYDRISTGSPCEVFVPPVPGATLEIVLDKKAAHTVDENSPVGELLRFGLWDNAYDASTNVQNVANDAINFVGNDFRRFYFRVKDPAATTKEVNVSWKTLKNDKTDDDVPASQVLTLQEIKPGSKVFVSKAVMLVTNDTDCDQQTDSGLAAPHRDTGIRRRGQSNHRLRRAKLDGFVKSEYKGPSGKSALVELPLFQRKPDERRRLAARVIRINNLANAATPAYIAGQFQHANARWNQVGIQIDPVATVDRAIPAGTTDAAGLYNGSADNPSEQALLNDLIPITPDNTLTVVFVPMSGANAYATVAQRNNVVLADRFFIFINTTLNLEGDTLAHELHHVLFNRFDTATPQQFYTFNTQSSESFGIPLPDVRVRRRIQNLHAPDPDNDPNSDSVLNWAKRRRTARFPIGGPLAAPTATTGNTLVGDF